VQKGAQKVQKNPSWREHS